MANLTFTPPADGAAVTMQNGRLCVPDRPVIPFIIGDGTGPEIWAAASRVIDAAVAKAYQGRRSIAWYEVFAGQKSFDNLGTWLPNETVEAFRTYLIGIKGPLTTPVGGGIRSLNVTLRQDLDLFVCLRPVRYFNGIETPVKAPEKVDMVVFRENTEDIYAGIEFKEGTEDAKLFFGGRRHQILPLLRQDGQICNAPLDVFGIVDIGRCQFHQMTNAPAYQIAVALQITVLTASRTEDFCVGHGHRGLFCYN